MMDKQAPQFLSIREAARRLGVSPSTLRRLEEDGIVKGYGLTVYYTPGGQRRYLSDQVNAYLMHQGVAGRIGFGVMPAVLAINLSRGFIDPESPMGFDLGPAFDRIRELLDTARRVQVPVIFSVTQYDPECRSMQLWKLKIPKLEILKPDSEWVTLDRRLHRRLVEPVFYTSKVSHLRNAELEAHLRSLSVDTLVICGCTTSGAIRTTAIDALQLGIRPVIPAEAVGDRTDSVHLASINDLRTRYADVVSLAEVLDWFARRESG